MSLDQDAVVVVVFDAYGTLLDVHSAINSQRDLLGDDAQSISDLWRQKQLEYSWLVGLRGDYRDFWALTEMALSYAFKAHDLETDTPLFQHLLDVYWRLSPYDDALSCLTWLKEQGFKTAILSNGSPDMLRAAVESAGISSQLDKLLSVDELKTFKPTPEVYEMVLSNFGVEKNEVLFISSNTWDAAAAKAFGFQVAWLNRSQAGQLDELPGTPDVEVSDLDKLPDLLF